MFMSYSMKLSQFCLFVFFFFFQAEDGIRDLVRSRGLGDVYKRQPTAYSVSVAEELEKETNQTVSTGAVHAALQRLEPVSYTHLTLPTSDLV